MITFDCPSCQKRLQALPDRAGMRLSCPNCSQPVQIPEANANVPTAEQSPDIDPFKISANPATPLPRRRKSSLGAIVIGASVVLCLVAGAGYFYRWSLRQRPQLSLPAINDAVVQEEQPVTFQVAVSNAAHWKEAIRYSLSKAPEGARIDSQTGEFSWTPTEAQGPGDYQITIRAAHEQDSATPVETSFHFTVKEFNESPKLKPIDSITATVGNPVRFRAEAEDPDIPQSAVKFRLIDGAPDGATIDETTGEFRWLPKEEDAGKDYEVVLEAAEVNGPLNALEIIHINVASSASPAEQLLADWKEDGAEVEFLRYGSELPLIGTSQVVNLAGGEVTVFEYATEEERNGDSTKIVAATTETADSVETDSTAEEPQTHYFQRAQLIVVYEGGDAAVLEQLEKQLGPAFATGKFTKTATTTESVPRKSVSPTEAATEEFHDRLARLHEYNLLLVPKRYKDVRHVFSDYFEAKFAAEIRAAFGEDYEETIAWLNEHRDIKEEFFTAFDNEHDNVEEGLRLFLTLKKEFPEQIEPYAGLAIAIAVCWDGNRNGIYDYGHHQRRVHAQMPDGLTDAVENFRYFVENQKSMQGRARFLPWEFLVHLINHRTPLDERSWALQNYLSKRNGIGTCYHDVPYDDEMLETSSQVCKMDGKDYTLANLKSFGGVCAQQADFAARVGKSLGVPAAYVRGESNSGGLHAWVMWVEVKQVNQTSINFELSSHGRYRNDKYYVGDLFDPQTGRQMTDRELELRLHTMGLNPLAARQASMVMRAYPFLLQRTQMDATEQLVYLRKVAELCPGDIDLWKMLATMSRDGTVEKRHSRQMKRSLDLFFQTFAGYPDFVWTVFDDLIAFEKDAKQRLALYERLVRSFEAVGRPDLACDARLKLCEYQIEQQANKQAIEGLALSIKKFPDEGRYVPRLLDRLEQVCNDVKGSTPLLIKFYQEFLPTVPPRRGDRPSEYCMKMYQRGIDFFNKQNQPELATLYQGKLEELKSGKSGS